MPSTSISCSGISSAESTPPNAGAQLPVIVSAGRGNPATSRILGEPSGSKRWNAAEGTGRPMTEPGSAKAAATLRALSSESGSSR